MFMVTFILDVLIITVIYVWVILAVCHPIIFTISSMVYVIPHIKKAVDAVPMMKEYLRNRFALKNGDKPHLMKF